MGPLKIDLQNYFWCDKWVWNRTNHNLLSSMRREKYNVRRTAVEAFSTTTKMSAAEAGRSVASTLPAQCVLLFSIHQFWVSRSAAMIGCSSFLLRRCGLHLLVTPLGYGKRTERFQTQISLQLVWQCQSEWDACWNQLPFLFFGYVCNMTFYTFSIYLYLYLYLYLDT